MGESPVNMNGVSEMRAVLFSLVVEQNPDLVFAWGMEIIHGSHDEIGGERKAVLYINGSDGQEGISTHASAEAACKTWSTIVPLSIEWDSGQHIDTYRELSESGVFDRS